MKKDISHLAEEISNVASRISNGSATLEDLEAFAAATAELHERAVIIRYKSYEAKVFGTPVEPVQDFHREPEMAETEETVVESAAYHEPVATEEAPQEQTPAQEVAFDLFADPQAVEEKEESFDLFSLDEADEEEDDSTSFFDEPAVENEQAYRAPEPESGTEEASARAEASAFSRELAEEQFTFGSDEAALEDAAFEQERPSFIHPEIEPVRSVFSNEDPVYNETTSAAGPAAEESEIENLSTAAEAPDPVTEIPETDPIDFAEPASFHREQQSAEPAHVHPVYSRLSADGSLAGRLLAVRLESLKGAFGLNERMQIIQELFQGSNDTFSQAIEKLDNLDSKGEARSVVTGYADRFDWKPDSQLVLDFVQKVERRYA